MGVHNMSTFEKVKEIVVEKLSCSADAVTMEARIQEDLGADSLDAVELIMFLEDDFGMSIPSDQAESLKTVGEIVKLIDSMK